MSSDSKSTVETSSSVSSGNKRKETKQVQQQQKQQRRANHSILGDDRGDDLDNRNDQMVFAGMNIEPTSRRLAASRESQKQPSARGGGNKGTQKSVSSRRSSVENYTSQSELRDFVDSHFVDWMDGAEPSYCNRSRTADLSRSVFLSILMFMTG